VPDRDLAFRLTRILRVGSFFMVAAIFHLAVSVRSRQRSLLGICVVCDYAIAGMFAVGNAFDLFVSDLRAFELGYVPVGTRLYNLLTVYAIVNFTAAITVLSRDYYTAVEPRVRVQIKFWLLGMLVALPLGLTNLLPVYGIRVYPLGNLGAALWAAIVAYAIVRHRLMDVEVVVRKGLSYLGVILLILVPFIELSLYLQRARFGRADYELTALLSLVVLGCILLSPLLLIGVEARVERVLFWKQYASRAALSAFGKSVIRILDRQRLVESLCEGLSRLLDLEGVAVYLLDASAARIELQQNNGLGPQEKYFRCDHSLVRWLAGRGEPSLADETERMLEGDAGVVKKAFRENGWELCVPLKSGLQITGFVGLGRKRNMKAFSAGDSEILKAIANEASVAFENARLYEEVQRSRDIIDRAGRLSALGTLAAGIAHEIRNPLVSIHTFFQMAPAKLDDEEFMTSFLQLVGGEVGRISRLIDDLLTFARAPAQHAEALNVNDVVGRALTLLNPEARKGRVELLDRMEPNLPLVLGDSDQILQVVINIILNGIQATPVGGRVVVETRLVVDEGGHCCRIEVSDNGPGISDELREVIFNPFFTTKDRGSGLGLAIANRIVAESGGFITVESKEGQGTRFSISLPATPPRSEATEQIGSVAKVEGNGEFETEEVEASDVVLRRA
jgi:two-component system nitrogen regulation sensor histidine kinase GlnL